MNGKKIIFALIAITNILVFIFALQFIGTGFFQSTDLIWVLGSMIGLFGFVLLFWQYMLGIRAIVTKFTNDLLWINKQHQKFGTYGFLFIAMHPILLWIAFNDGRYDLLTLKFDTDYDKSVSLGKLAITVLAFIWIISAVARTKLSYRLWKMLHFLAYPILLIVFFHSMGVGTFFGNPNLKMYFNILFAIFICGSFYRLLFQLGFTKHKYVLISKEQITSNTVKLNFEPLAKPIKPAKGQFVYIQTDQFSENHPFTISHFDESTHIISITPKASGPFSMKLHKLSEGSKVFIDGPYGVFTEEAYKTDKPIVLIAGGIGITPFLRFIESVVSKSDKQVTLFYGNQTEDDIAFKKELNSAQAINANFKVIHVLSGKPGSELVVSNPLIEKGYITIDLMKKYLGDNFSQYDFFICGPPVMMNKLIPILEQGGVEEVYSERFSL
jgi:predicted ferric reductase